MPTKHRLIIDTNLWLSFLLRKDYSKADQLLLNDNIVLFFSQELIEEFIGVTHRKKFRKYFSLDDLEDLLHKLYAKITFILVEAEVKFCRDPKDNFYYPLPMTDKQHT